MISGARAIRGGSDVRCAPPWIAEPQIIALLGDAWRKGMRASGVWRRSINPTEIRRAYGQLKKASNLKSAKKPFILAGGDVDTKSK